MVVGVIATYFAIANSEYLEVLARETEHRVLTSGLKRETTQIAS
jgi:hypothetical protein